MNIIAVFFLTLNAAALFLLPRRLAPIPLILGACYMTLAQGIEIGPFNFTFIRMLIAVGIVRILLRGERIAGGMNRLDWLMVMWAAWALISSMFRPDASDALIFRLGLVYNTCGIYFLLRIFCQSLEDLRILITITAFLLMPIALEMFYEQVRHHNLFSELGGVQPRPNIRDGNVRSQGPFRHAILAGTVGAVCFPFMVALYSRRKTASVVGAVSCIMIVMFSNSSGPMVSLFAGVGGLFMWRYRHRMRMVRWLAVIGYITLDFAMKAPAYFLMSRIPLVSGSTGWHRARLIQSSFEHLNEWWLAGTEYTRHWMPTGVSWSPDHADITNHYIKMGVWGGLPLMLLFIYILIKGFSYLGQAMHKLDDEDIQSKFFIWAIGASLFANAATMLSVSYFDQSFIFLYLTLAAIGSIWSATQNPEVDQEQD
jgi:hypothetical protein